MIDAVFFDMDNTLVHTEWAAARAVRHVVESFGKRFEKADEDAVIGLPWETIFDNAIARYGVPLARDALRRRILDEKALILGDDPHALPGAVKALRRCAARWPVAVVSGSYREEVAATLAALGVAGSVRFFIANEDIVNGKPEPDPYLEAARRLKARPAHCVVFEDSEVGTQAARRAGMYVVAVLAAPDAAQTLDAAHDRLASLEAVDEAWLDALAARIGGER